MNVDKVTAMQILTQNTILVGRIVVFLFFLASSGFTSVLHICAMEASRCCDMPSAGASEGCQNPGPREAAGSIQSEFSCLTKIVAGGLVGVQGLLEKGGSRFITRQDGIVAAVSHDVTATVRNTALRFFSPRSFCAMSPPPAEKYVLNSSFLI